MYKKLIQKKRKKDSHRHRTVLCISFENKLLIYKQNVMKHFLIYRYFNFLKYSISYYYTQ